MRNAIRYVLQNARHHEANGRMVRAVQALDNFSSASWFDGFVESITVRNLPPTGPPVRPAQTWLLATGWRRRGLLPVHDLPATG